MPEALQAEAAPVSPDNAVVVDQPEAGSQPALAPEAPQAPEPAPRDTTPDWPSDWRAKLSGEDSSAAKMLDRFGSPVEVFKSHRELQKKLSSEPRMPKAPGPDSSPEERNAYRKELGIPEEPGGYDTRVAEGYEWSEGDKPVLDAFLQFAHDRDMPPGQVKNAISWWPEYVARTNQEQKERDSDNHNVAYDTLEKEWGHDFIPRLTAADNLTNTWPKAVRDSVLGSRGRDGRLLCHNQDFLRELAQMAKTINPAATLVPAGTQDEPKALASRKQEITGMMHDHSSPYWRGPQLPDGSGTALMKEYRDILDAEAAIKKRNNG